MDETDGMRSRARRPRLRPLGPALALGCLASMVAALERPSGEMVVTVWETDEGLPNNDVHALLQDASGFLWVGTAGGLVRFDGRSFRHPARTEPEFFQAATTYSIARTGTGEIVFVHDIDAENRLLRVTADGILPHPADRLLAPDERATAVFDGGDGSLWVHTEDRAWVHWQDGAMHRFPPPPRTALFQPPAVIPLADGRTLLSRGSGLELHENGQIRQFNGLWQGPVTVAASPSGGHWIADGRGLFRLLDDGTLAPRDLPVPGTATWPPQLMLEAVDGALWMVFRDGGLWHTSHDGATPVPVSHPIVRCLIEDREGNLWAGTAGGGLNRIRTPAFTLRAAELGDTIGTICQDADGTMWLGNSRGVWRLDGGGRVEAPESPERWPGFAHSLCPTPDGALWIGGAKQVFRYHPATSPYPVPVGPPAITHAFALFHAGDGSVWAGCQDGPLLRFDANGGFRTYGPEAGYTGEFAQVFGQDDAGTLWVGTRRGELFALAGDRFEKTATPLEETGTGILTITPGAAGALWLGTRGIGFLRLKDERFDLVGPRHGLPDGIIAQALLVDGTIWVGSSNSIFKIPLADMDACADGLLAQLRPLRFGRGDGVAGFYATGQRQPCAWRDADGGLWFFGRSGVVRTRPEYWTDPPSPPPVLIDDILADAGRLPEPFRLPSGNRRLEFRFTSPTLSASTDLRFRYRLRGLEEDWSEPTNQSMAVYPKLTPGNYVFEVSSSTRPLSWSPVAAAVGFSVTPAWWEIGWLRAAAAAVALVSAFFAVRAWSNHRLRRKTSALEQEGKLERERIRIARDLHDGIGSGLTQLGWLAAELKDTTGDARAADQHIENISGKIRNLARDLDATVWAVSPRHDTLGSICAYLCEFALEHFRHTPVRCRVSAPEQLPQGPLAPQIRNHLFMATREVLNNTLKHANASEVRVGIRCDSRLLAIEIEDDGTGFDIDAALRKRRHGLRNLHDRLQEIHGTVEITSGPGHGTRLRLLVPLA
jgi:signal transduction histidine kinase/ligand-binding sensor domain-containing protein